MFVARILLFFFLVSGALTSTSQTEHFASLRATTHFDFGLRAPSMDDAGFGLQVDANFFAKQKLNLTLSTNIEHMLGDKVMVLSNEGRENKPGRIYGVTAGPEYFFSSRFSASVTYGVYWQSFRQVDYSSDDGFKFSVAAFLGKKRDFVINFQRIIIPTDFRNISYYNFGVGYRFF